MQRCAISIEKLRRDGNIFDCIIVVSEGPIADVIADDIYVHFFLCKFEFVLPMILMEWISKYCIMRLHPTGGVKKCRGTPFRIFVELRTPPPTFFKVFVDESTRRQCTYTYPQHT